MESWGKSEQNRSKFRRQGSEGRAQGTEPYPGTGLITNTKEIRTHFEIFHLTFIKQLQRCTPTFTRESPSKGTSLSPCSRRASSQRAARSSVDAVDSPVRGGRGSALETWTFPSLICPSKPKID